MTDQRPRDRSVERLALFSDVVFALVLVLIPAHILLPETYVTSGVLHDAIGDAAPQLFGSAVAFAAIAVLWVDQHQLLDRLTARDETLLWLHSAFMGCVVLLSYPAAVLTKHIGAPVAIVVFAGAMAITALAWSALWWWASGRPELVGPGVSREARRKVLNRSLTTPVAFILGAALAPVDFSVRGTSVSLAIVAWIALLPLARLAVAQRN